MTIYQRLVSALLALPDPYRDMQYYALLNSTHSTTIVFNS